LIYNQVRDESISHSLDYRSAFLFYPLGLVGSFKEQRYDFL